MALQRLKDAQKKLKRLIWRFTNSNFITIYFGESGPLHLEISLTRSKFEELAIH